jgi:magnesium-transporting ATPase (P-type)
MHPHRQLQVFTGAGGRGGTAAAGTDIAMESADITLMRGDLRAIATAVKFSKATMRNIRRTYSERPFTIW